MIPQAELEVILIEGIRESIYFWERVTEVTPGETVKSSSVSFLCLKDRPCSSMPVLKASSSFHTSLTRLSPTLHRWKVKPLPPLRSKRRVSSPAPLEMV